VRRASVRRGSGKSLVFNLPTLAAVVESRGRARALYMFPTKALAQDQCRALRTLIRASDALGFIRTATFDGDTPMDQRERLRDESHILLTNPDMVHRTILSQHGRWAEVRRVGAEPARRSTTWADALTVAEAALHAPGAQVLRELRYVLLDEVHVYGGLFGSHVALVIRRLRRLCDHYGNHDVRFICCSATIGTCARRG